MEIELRQETEAQKTSGDERDLVNTSFKTMGDGHSFNAILKGVEVISATPPTILATLTLADEHMNDEGLLHTGFAAAMADVLTAAAVRITAAKENPVVSVDLSVTILHPAQNGDTLLMEANCLRADRSIAFTEAIFRRKSDGQLIAKATQQLAILFYLPLKPKERGEGTGDTEKGTEESHRRQNELANATNGFSTKNGRNADGDKLSQAQHLVGRMANTKNFNRVAENLRVVNADTWLLVVETELGHNRLNEGGTMHGGFVASLVDIVSVCAVGIAAPNWRSMTSMFISISYLMPATIGEEIVVKTDCLKVGRSIAFTETTVSRKRDGAVLAKGKHNISLARHADGSHR